MRALTWDKLQVCQYVFQTNSTFRLLCLERRKNEVKLQTRLDLRNVATFGKRPMTKTRHGILRDWPFDVRQIVETGPTGWWPLRRDWHLADNPKSQTFSRSPNKPPLFRDCFRTPETHAFNDTSGVGHRTAEFPSPLASAIERFLTRLGSALGAPGRCDGDVTEAGCFATLLGSSLERKHVGHLRAALLNESGTPNAESGNVVLPHHSRCVTHRGTRQS